MVLVGPILLAEKWGFLLLRAHTMRRHARKLGQATLVVALLPGVSAAQMKIVTDETGRRVSLPARAERIVSLAPNLTEMLFALGLGPRVVGVTDWCNFPPEARALPRIGQVISPSLEQIAALKPQLVLATTAGNRRETVAGLERLGIPVYAFNSRTVEDVLLSLRGLAELVGRPQAGVELEAALRARLEAVAARVNEQPHPRVLFVLWLEPLMTVGRHTFVHDALVRAGADSVSADRAEDWPRLSWEEVLRQNPDYLVLAHSPALEQRLKALRTSPTWGRLEALREGRVIVLDEAVLRPGPRIVDAIEQLARTLHPEGFRTP
jgi:iron complex transport system substrate-binding protein